MCATPARHLVQDDQRDERQEVDHVAPGDTQRERGYEEDEEVAVGSQVQPAGGDHPAEADGVAADQEREASPRERRAFALGVVAIALVAVLVRLRFLDVPLPSTRAGTPPSPLLGRRLPSLPGRLGRSAAGPSPSLPRGVRPLRGPRLGRPRAGDPVWAGLATRSCRCSSPVSPIAARGSSQASVGCSSARASRGSPPTASSWPPSRPPRRSLVFAIWLRAASARAPCSRPGALAAFALLVKQSGVRRRRRDRRLAPARGLARLAPSQAGAARARPDRARAPHSRLHCRSRTALRPASTATGSPIADYRLSVESVATGSFGDRMHLLWSAFATSWPCIVPLLRSRPFGVSSAHPLAARGPARHLGRLLADRLRDRRALPPPLLRRADRAVLGALRARRPAARRPVRGARRGDRVPSRCSPCLRSRHGRSSRLLPLSCRGAPRTTGASSRTGRWGRGFASARGPATRCTRCTPTRACTSRPTATWRSSTSGSSASSASRTRSATFAIPRGPHAPRYVVVYQPPRSMPGGSRRAFPRCCARYRRVSTRVAGHDCARAPRSPRTRRRYAAAVERRTSARAASRSARSASAAWACRGPTARRRRRVGRGRSTAPSSSASPSSTPPTSTAPFTNEQLVGRALAGRRDEVVLATKAGSSSRTRRPRLRHRRPARAHPRGLRGSLRRLGIDHIDLYYLHRVDPEVPVEDTFGAMAELVAEGKVRALGLSEVDAATLARAARDPPDRRAAVRVSLWTRDALAECCRWCASTTSRFVRLRAARARLPDRRAAGRLDLRRGTTSGARSPRFQRRLARRRTRPIVERVRAVAAGAARRRPRSRSRGCSRRARRHPDPGHEAPALPRGERRRGGVALAAERLAELDALPAPAGTRY